MQLALSVVPGVEFDSFWTAVAASWIAAAFGTLLTWLISAGTDESFAATLLRLPAEEVDDPEVDGVVFVQLDGVSYPVMQWALQSGSMPTLRRWTDEGRAGPARVDRAAALHDAGLPAGDPDGQRRRRAGVPVVRPGARPGPGRQPPAGRLDHRGPGEHRSRTARRRRGLDLQPVHRRRPQGVHDDEPAGGVRGAHDVRVSSSPASWCGPTGCSAACRGRSPRWSASGSRRVRQRRLAVHPRVHRSWTFAGLRAFSNGLLRDLNTAVVAEEMMRGARSIYVDYVDYDEIAHHAGSTRIESLAALTGLDQVLAVLEKVAERAPRRYHFVHAQRPRPVPGPALRRAVGHRPLASCARS